jgi:protein TonB
MWFRSQRCAPEGIELSPVCLHNSPMILTLLLLAQATTAAPPPPAQDHVVPLFSVEEVPEEAVRYGWSGVAKADLTITPEGRVSACTIVQSTGHKLLDDFTCKVLMMRARFTPAKDKDGKPVESHYLTPPITYKFG